MTSRSLCKSLALCLVALAGCRDAPRIVPKAEAKAEPVSTAPETTALPAPDPAIARMPLAERLAREARARPPEATRPAELVRGLEERGVSFVRTRQVLAGPVGAAYCETAVSQAGLGISVCEYADAAAATAGSAHSHAQFDAIVPGRTLIAKGNTLLTMTHPEGATAEREAELARNVFAALTPSARVD